jgi:hypothetical protein
LVRALRRGEAFVTSGPLLDVAVDGKRPGETAAIDGETMRVTVVARAPSWMDLAWIEIYVGGDLAHVERVIPRRSGATIRAESTVELPARDESFVVVVVRGERPMDALLAPRRALPIAFSNPVWLR